MNFPLQTPMFPGGGARAGTEHARARLRDYVKENGITVLDSEGRALEIDELLDEALGQQKKVPKAVAIIGVSLMVLLAVWMLIVLLVRPG